MNNNWVFLIEKNKINKMMILMTKKQLKIK